MTTQADLARLDNIHPVRFSGIVRGRINPAEKTGKKLLRRYGGSLEIWTQQRFAENRKRLVKDYLSKF